MSAQSRHPSSNIQTSASTTIPFSSSHSLKGSEISDNGDHNSYFLGNAIELYELKLSHIAVVLDTIESDESRESMTGVSNPMISMPSEDDAREPQRHRNNSMVNTKAISDRVEFDIESVGRNHTQSLKTERIEEGNNRDFHQKRA